LLPMDKELLKKELIPKERSILKGLAKADTGKRRILVIGRHRYYPQLNFLLMEADLAQSGKLKNPIDRVDPMPLVWNADDPKLMKFYTAVAAFQHTYQEDYMEAELAALKLIVENPMELDVYYHDREVSETITAKSLLPVELRTLQAEIRLMVFKKEPFYEITGELQFNDTSLPFSEVIIRNDCFVYHRQAFYFVDHPDLLRVIKFFKSNNEILLIHGSKYPEFVESVLSPLEELVHIHYSYIHTATAVQLAEKNFDREPIVYLHQEGNYISITPVMKYGIVEVSVYSRKQLLDTDQNGNEF